MKGFAKIAKANEEGWQHGRCAKESLAALASPIGAVVAVIAVLAAAFVSLWKKQ
jgi:phage-related protein